MAVFSKLFYFFQLFNGNYQEYLKKNDLLEITRINLNDGTIEGFKIKDKEEGIL